MAINTFVEIEIPEVADLADLTGIPHNFDRAKPSVAQDTGHQNINLVMNNEPTRIAFE